MRCNEDGATMHVTRMLSKRDVMPLRERSLMPPKKHDVMRLIMHEASREKTCSLNGGDDGKGLGGLRVLVLVSRRGPQERAGRGGGPGSQG